MLARMWRKRNTSPFLVGLQADIITLEISLANSLKIGQILTEVPAIPLLGIYTEDIPTGNKDTCSTMFKGNFKWFLRSHEYNNRLV
jgi:hypothetical protein